MLISCSACGKVHERKTECKDKKEKMCSRRKKYTEAVSVRNRSIWRKTRERVLERDSYMCQACARQVPGTTKRYNATQLEVHHITPLEEDIELAYEEGNLLTLCRKHHEDAENGTLSRQWQQDVAEEQIRKAIENI